MRTIRLLLIVMFVLGMWVSTAQAELSTETKVGVVVKVVTPNPLIGVSGGVGQPEPVTKKEGDLTVRALVIQHTNVTSTARVAIVSGDFLGFPSPLCERVRAEVKGIPPGRIIIGVTHCHSAPDMYAFTDEKGNCGADMKYIDFVCKEMAKAINEAVSKLEPAVMKVATDEAKGKIAYNYYAPELYDHRMNVIQFLASAGEAKGKPIATLVNYATHPEVLGPDRGILSPDLCGPLYDRIAEKGGGTAIFMNSAQGGMVTADVRGPDGKDVQTWEECIRIGNLMADEALRIIAPAPIQENPKLACFATTIKLPITSPLMQAILKGSPLGFKTDADGSAAPQINVVNLGTAQILTIPGEALPNIGFYLKRKMYGQQNLLFGLTNDAFGYILTKEDWDSFKRYEYITRTSLGEMTGEIYVKEALDFVNKCPRPTK